MKVKDLYEELQDKKFFQDFKKQNPETFLYAGFFVLEIESSSEKLQLDFYDPKQKKIEIVEFPFEKIKVQENSLPGLEDFTLDSEKINPLNLELKIDIDDLENSVKKVLEKNNSKVSPTKIIAVLKDNVWNLTCMDNMLSVVTIKIDAGTGDEISFKKNSLLDIVKVKR